MTMYSLNGAMPEALPFRVALADGSTRTDPSSFTPEELAAWGYTGPHVPPAFNPQQEVLDWDGTDYVVRPMTAEELAAARAQQWADVRAERNRRLLHSDYTQLPDAPVDPAPWAVYRQALRDITTQPDPFAIVWPVSP